MSYYSQIILHMVLMLIFLSFSLAGIITAKYFKRKNPKWLKLHKFFMISSVSAALIGFGWIFYVVQSGMSPHFSMPHTILGLVTIILTLIAPIIGFRFINKNTDNTQKPLLRKLHRTFGWISLSLIIITITSGLVLFGIISLPF
jgi:heme A synthase